MKCPVCKQHGCEQVQLEGGLEAQRCDGCGGHWVALKNYEAWRTALKADIPEQAPSAVKFEVNELAKAKLCPECGRILLRFKVGHGLDFFVERCGGCGGVWLDRNEWEALHARGLDDDLHRIFSPTWQEHIRTEALRQKIERIYEKRFGAEAYRKARDIRAWVQHHPEKRALIAFLTEDNPFGLGKEE